jgi:propionyl-CoA synthetase
MTNSTYDEVYARWLDAPESFWAETAEAVHWYKKWNHVLDASRPPFYRWFTGGMVMLISKKMIRYILSLIMVSLRAGELHAHMAP